MTGTHFDIRSFKRVLSRRRFTVLLVATASAAGGFFHGTSESPTFTASATVLVARPDASRLDDASMATDARLATSRTVAARVARALGLRETPVALSDAAVAMPSTEELLEISVSAATAPEAIRRANAFATEFLAWKTERAIAIAEDAAGALDDRAAAARSRVGEIDAAMTPSPAPDEAGKLTAERDGLTRQADALTAKAGETRALAAAAAAPGTLADPAATAAPSGHQPARDAALGLISGLILGIGLVLVQDHFDSRIWNRDEAARIGGAPVVTALPHRPSPATVQSGHRTLAAWLSRAGTSDVTIFSVGAAGASARATFDLLQETDAAVTDGGELGEHEPPALGRTRTCVLVVRAGETKRARLARATAVLARAGVRCSAVVLLNVQDDDETTGVVPGTPLRAAPKPVAKVAASSRRGRVSQPAPLRHDRIMDPFPLVFTDFDPRNDYPNGNENGL